MDYFLTETQKMIVDTCREFAEKRIKPVRAKYDEEETFPWDVIKAMGEADLSGLYIPSSYGGFGGGIFELCLAVEEMSKVCSGITLAMAATALGTFPILLFGTEEQKKKYLPDIAKGKKLAAFGLTESNAGSDAGAMQTIAKEEGSYYVLNGTKQWITNAGEAEVYTVIAMTDKSKGSRGATAFIVEKDAPGFTFGKKEKKLGIRASATRELIFQECKIPKENILAKVGMGFIVTMNTLFTARPGVAAQALGIAAGALEESVNYSKVRYQFNQPLSSIQAIQHKLAEMATEIEAARALLYSTARMIDSGAKNFAKESAMCKLLCSDVAMRVTIEAIQIFGGYGYMREYPVEKMMRDAKITQIYEGTNEIQKNEIALNLIKESSRKK